MKTPSMASTMATVAASCSSYQQSIASLAATISPRVLVNTSGSGNFGESGKAAFYTIDKLPAALNGENAGMTQNDDLKRQDIDLGPNRLAFHIDNVLTDDEADSLAACAEAVLNENGHSRVAPGIRTPPGMRINDAAHWYPPHDSSFMKNVFKRIAPLVPPSLDGMPLYPKLSEKVAQFKYNQGDRFNRHVDGLFPGQGINVAGNGVDEWQGVVSGLSLLFFLNDADDGLQGGATRLWSADGSQHVDVTPRKGRVLAFRRGSPDAVLHAGLQVTSETVPKYMALINLAYGEQTGTSPLMQ